MQSCFDVFFLVLELSTWDAEAAKCDINEQLGLLSNQQPTKAEDPTGEFKHRQCCFFVNNNLQDLSVK